MLIILMRIPCLVIEKRKKKISTYMYFKKHVKVIRENVLSLATFIILENFN
jgi:hypothetical protein